MTEPDDDAIPRIVEPDLRIISGIDKLFQNGYVANVDKIKGDLRAQDLHFANERVNEIITNLDGIIITRTGEKKGSLKEYERIELEKINQGEFRKMLEEAKENLRANTNLMVEMKFYYILITTITSHEGNDEEFEKLLHDLCLMFAVVSRQKLAITESGIKSPEYQNMKNQLGHIVDRLSSAYGIFSKVYPQMKSWKKQFDEMENSYLHSEFQRRMLFYLEVPEQ